MNVMEMVGVDKNEIPTSITIKLELKYAPKLLSLST